MPINESMGCKTRPLDALNGTLSTYRYKRVSCRISSGRGLRDLPKSLKNPTCVEYMRLPSLYRNRWLVMPKLRLCWSRWITQAASHQLILDCGASQRHHLELPGRLPMDWDTHLGVRSVLLERKRCQHEPHLFATTHVTRRGRSEQASRLRASVYFNSSTISFRIGHHQPTSSNFHARCSGQLKDRSRDTLAFACLMFKGHSASDGG